MGSKEDAADFAQLAATRGYQTLSFDLPEHGERAKETTACYPWDAINDLNAVYSIAQNHWNSICLYATSLGAYFSLLAYRDHLFHRCLFVSPIINMAVLIENLMASHGISARQLEMAQEIKIDNGEPLNWDYYRYTIDHPINKWNSPTAILYPSEDNLTSISVIEDFTRKFDSNLTIFDAGEHWFHTPEQLTFLRNWLAANISAPVPGASGCLGEGHRVLHI